MTQPPWEPPASDDPRDRPSGEPPGTPPGMAKGPYAPPPGRRFATGAVLGGIAVGILGPVFGLALIATLVAATSGGQGSVVAQRTSVLGIVALLGPLVVGIVLAVRHGSPTRRGFGLGLAIGWGVLVIVGGGVCVALLMSFTPAG